MKFIYYASSGAPFDADAADYITRVNAVDAANGASGGLEAGLQDIIHILFRDLKLDASPFAGVSNFAALKASCLLAGPRTRQGCAVPLLASMPTPTFVGTTAGWNFNRKTGLRGNGTDNYLNSNRSGGADPTNNSSQGVYATEAQTGNNSSYIGSEGAALRKTIYLTNVSGGIGFSSSSSSILSSGAVLSTVGLIGQSRQQATTLEWIAGANSGSAAFSTGTDTFGNFYVFARNGNPSTNAASLLTNARLSYYWIGEAIDRGLLNTRITAYMTALNALTLT